MSGFTQYAADQVLGLVAGTNITAPASKYLALHTGNPGATGAANEASYTNYARIAITSGQFSAITTSVDKRVRSNNAVLNWAANGSATTQTFTHVTLWDAASGGNCWYVYDLPASVATVPGNIPTLVVGDLSHGMRMHQ